MIVRRVFSLLRPARSVVSSTIGNSEIDIPRYVIFMTISTIDS